MKRGFIEDIDRGFGNDVERRFKEIVDIYEVP